MHSKHMHSFTLIIVHIYTRLLIGIAILSRMGTLSADGAVISIVTPLITGIISYRKEFAPTEANYFL